jgi:hypothetical protein
MYANETESPLVGAVNIEFVIPYLYPDLDFIMFTYSANATANDVAI